MIFLVVVVLASKIRSTCKKESKKKKEKWETTQNTIRFNPNFLHTVHTPRHQNGQKNVLRIRRITLFTRLEYSTVSHIILKKTFTHTIHRGWTYSTVRRPWTKPIWLYHHDSFIPSFDSKFKIQYNNIWKCVQYLRRPNIVVIACNTVTLAKQKKERKKMIKKPILKLKII